MNASELRQKTKEELNSMLLDLSREQFNLKMQKATGQLSKPDQVKKVRRDIARIHTILREMASTAS
ncbi:50S ribosomal protein L29 [methane-oxidizing endosymbiont of Gigantopelta aegis]|uniref:50S ribosomal protein L29 n=1 Tax=methane-oxidizing endosymbiont of Gigantopelta aegis TaxID=2794938 RepID=UPI0018DB5936|nr:50S ribosomal protein L29 [methane-oxidizing endosymbiont of Gigantopelta aegis]